MAAGTSALKFAEPQFHNSFVPNWGEHHPSFTKTIAFCKSKPRGYPVFTGNGRKFYSAKATWTAMGSVPSSHQPVSPAATPVPAGHSTQCSPLASPAFLSIFPQGRMPYMFDTIMSRVSVIHSEPPLSNMCDEWYSHQTCAAASLRSERMALRRRLEPCLAPATACSVHQSSALDALCMKLYRLLPDPALHAMLGGQEYYDRTPVALREASVMRAFKAKAGTSGANLQGVCYAIESYRSFKRHINDDSPLFPILPAMAVEAAICKQQQTQAPSTASNIMASWRFAANNLGVQLPVAAPIMRAVPRYQSDGSNKKLPPPWELVHDLENSAHDLPHSPMRFAVRNVVISILCSWRAVDLYRAVFDERLSNIAQELRGSCVFDLPKTKRGENHQKCPLPHSGFFRSLTWLTEHLSLWKRWGYSVPASEGPLATATRFLNAQLSKSDMSQYFMQVFAHFGYNDDRCRALKLSGRSPHSLMLSISTLL